MSHNCGSTCRRKQANPTRCDTCRRSASLGPTRHASPKEIAAAVDMYFAGMSYRKVARHMGEHHNLQTGKSAVHNWVQDYSKKASEIASEFPVKTGTEWVADECAVKVGGRQYWLFNVMDSDTRFVLAAYLSPERTTRAAATAMAMARERAANAPKTIKTDGLRSYREGIGTAFRNNPVKHVVSEGIRAELNNNLSERLQGTFRDRDKTLRSMKKRETGQNYIDGLVLHYNYFRPHMGLGDKTPAVTAGADAPFKSWTDIATLETAE
ncbi:MAG: IS6 family transposase [Chloroflexi bacterium]|nr:IS6 family transposase [Chloroflexota bacterium]MYD47289.1 IS6 family transposase [Chloroflexota bacterium]